MTADSVIPIDQLLNDDLILKILNYLNLNEKCNLRLVNEKIKNLVDFIPITKLIIYEKHPQLAGKFKMTDEKFDVEDTAYVYDLNLFFKSEPIIANFKKSLSKLIIYGLDLTLVFLGESFDKLRHLELNDVNFSDATILESPRLQKLLIYRSSFTICEKFDFLLQKHQVPKATFDHLLGLGDLNSKIKHLNISDFNFLENELDFLKLCVESKAFSKLEIFEVNLDDLNNLIYLSNEMKSLKEIRLFSGKTFEQFQDSIRRNPLKKLIKQLRTDLTVYLFGVPLLENKIEIISDFFYNVSNKVKLNIPYAVAKDMVLRCGDVLLSDSVLTIENGNEFYEEIDTINQNKELFSGFVDLVDTICFKEELRDLEELRFYQKFKNVHTITFTFFLNLNFDLPATFKAFSEVKNLKLISIPLQDAFAYDNKVLKKIPVYCKKLVNLHIEFWDPFADFDFLLLLNPQIKWLKLLLRYPIDEDIYLEFLKKFGKQCLSYLEIYFVQSARTKEELSEFKKKVLKLIEDMKITRFTFKIEIHTHKEIKVCRVLYRRNDLCRQEIDNVKASDSEIKKVVFCIKEKQEDHKNYLN